MIEKEITFEYDSSTDCPIQLLDTQFFNKTASYAVELQDAIDKLERKIDHIYVLVNALSAGEYFGPNRNGDYFPEKELINHHKTYESLGYQYRRHDNKDPKKSFGKVVFAYYNPQMKRVEIIVELPTKSNKDIIARMQKGEYPATSMGCFPKETSVITEGFIKKNIEDIKIDDNVITHKGRVRKVTKLYSRKYSGDVYKITPVGNQNKEVTATKEHPWLVVTPEIFYELDYKKRKIRNKNLLLNNAVWKTSEELTGNEYLVIPKYVSKEIKTSSNSFAKFLGWYLAEGHTGKNDNGITFSVNKEDEIVGSIAKIADDLNLGKVHTRLHPRSDKGLIIAVYSKEYKQKALKNCGKYAKEKVIYKDIFDWSVENKLAFLGAYISGDGFYHENRAFISSANRELLEQIQWLALSINIKSTLGINEHKAGHGFSHHDTTEYILRFSKKANRLLSKHCEKVKSTKFLTDSGTQIFEYDDFYLTGINSIKKLKYNGNVYNFEVEEDNTYVVERYAVHNCKVSYDVCSICGNQAKTRAQYCDHLKIFMGRTMNDGRRVYAINPNPKFFDSSWVDRPAEVTAGVLAKVASMDGDKEADEKEAIIKKEIPMEISDMEKDPKNLILCSQGKIPKQSLKKISEFSDGEILSTLEALRIMPTSEEFDELNIDNVNERSEVKVKIAEELSNLLSDLVLTKPRIMSRLIKTSDVTNKNISDKYKQFVSDFNSSSSYTVKLAFKHPWLINIWSGDKLGELETQSTILKEGSAINNLMVNVPESYISEGPVKSEFNKKAELLCSEGLFTYLSADSLNVMYNSMMNWEEN